MSIVYRDRTVVVKSRRLSKHLEERVCAVPNAVSGVNGLSSPGDSSPASCPKWSLRSVYYGLPYQKGSTGQRLTGAFTVHCGASRRDVRRAKDYRPGFLDRCWGSDTPGPMVAVGNPPITNDCNDHTANWAWGDSLRNTHAPRVALLRQSVRRVTVKDGAFVEVRSVSRCDKRQSIYPTPNTSQNQRPNNPKP